MISDKKHFIDWIFLQPCVVKNKEITKQNGYLRFIISTVDKIPISFISMCKEIVRMEIKKCKQNKYHFSV